MGFGGVKAYIQVGIPPMIAGENSTICLRTDIKDTGERGKMVVAAIAYIRFLEVEQGWR